MKKVLYIAPLVVGFQDILEGSTESMGLPSFILPLKKIQESEGHKVDIVLISNFTKQYKINVSWLSSEDIVGNINNDLTTKNIFLKIYRKIKSSVQLINLLLRITKKNDYEVIYCHGKAAVWGNIISIIRKIPCAYRLYGTASYYDDLIKYGKWIGAFRNPIYSMIFKLPKKFLMITDDGSNGDKVYELMKPKTHEYPLYFLLNGVDHESIEELDISFIPKRSKFIFHAGRIDPVKRQDRNIQILKTLRDKGHNIELYLAGHYDENTDYYKQLVSLIQELKLEEYIHFMGPIKRGHLKAMSYYAVCTLLMGDIANNGSVFYEVFSTGSIVVGLDGDGLRMFIEDKINGFLVSSNEEAIDVINKVIDLDSKELNRIRFEAIKTSREKLLNWDERIDKEIRLLFD